MMKFTKISAQCCAKNKVYKKFRYMLKKFLSRRVLGLRCLFSSAAAAAAAAAACVCVWVEKKENQF
jgi:hypothetical protein